MIIRSANIPDQIFIKPTDTIIYNPFIKKDIRMYTYSGPSTSNTILVDNSSIKDVIYHGHEKLIIGGEFGVYTSMDTCQELIFKGGVDPKTGVIQGQYKFVVYYDAIRLVREDSELLEEIKKYLNRSSQIIPNNQLIPKHKYLTKSGKIKIYLGLVNAFYWASGKKLCCEKQLLFLNTMKNINKVTEDHLMCSTERHSYYLCLSGSHSLTEDQGEIDIPNDYLTIINKNFQSVIKDALAKKTYAFMANNKDNQLLATSSFVGDPPSTFDFLKYLILT